MAAAEADVTDTTYRVFQQQDGSYAVELTQPGRLAQLAVGFASEAAASDWVAQDKRLRDAADPFTSRRRGW